MNSVLFITVGGSHQPIVTALRALGPDYIVFFCTDRDPETGRPGSKRLIEGGGAFIQAAPRDARPSLPNIPTQCALDPTRYEVRTVPADDLDAAYAIMAASFADARKRKPEGRMVADYTGGTKTMSAALVLAALDAGAELQFVTGTRSDLVKVREGTQEAAPAHVEAVRLERELRPALAAWRRYAYDEAVTGLEQIPVPSNARLRQQRHRAMVLSRAFAAWDRFDHAAAHALVQPFEAALRPTFAGQLDALRVLAEPVPANRTRRDGLRIWDLWRNAQRRAAARRYDDAVARAYRMLEWTAQWILETRKGWRTERLPEDVARAAGIVPTREGVFQAPLFQAWTLVAAHAAGGAARFFESQRAAMLDHLRRRNASILAHGFEPVDDAAWKAFAAWLEDAFEPMLRDELRGVGATHPFPQLPDAYPFGAW